MTYDRDRDREVVRETTVVDDRGDRGGPGASLLVALLLILLLLVALWYFGVFNAFLGPSGATTAPGGGATTVPGTTAPSVAPSPSATAT